jgi:hypothetical protein
VSSFFRSPDDSDDALGLPIASPLPEPGRKLHGVAVSIDTCNFRYSSVLADVHIELLQSERALRTLERVARCWPDSTQVQLSLAADPAALAGEGPRGLAVHLIPDGREQPQVPDWFGYRLI